MSSLFDPGLRSLAETTHLGARAQHRKGLLAIGALPMWVLGLVAASPQAESEYDRPDNETVGNRLGHFRVSFGSLPGLRSQRLEVVTPDRRDVPGRRLDSSQANRRRTRPTHGSRTRSPQRRALGGRLTPVPDRVPLCRSHDPGLLPLPRVRDHPGCHTRLGSSAQRRIGDRVEWPCSTNPRRRRRRRRTSVRFAAGPCRPPWPSRKDADA